MKILISSKPRNKQGTVQIKGNIYSNGTDSCFEEIKEINPVIKTFPKGTILLITLNVTDNWCDTEGNGAWFGISVNNVIKARGLYTTARNNQRIPITLQTVVEVTEDKTETEIKAMWCNTGQGTCHIGEYSEATLTIVYEDFNMNQETEEKIAKFTSEMLKQSIR